MYFESIQILANLLNGVLHRQKSASCHGKRRSYIIPTHSWLLYSRYIYKVQTKIPEKLSLEFWVQKIGSSKVPMVSYCKSEGMRHNSHIESVLNPTDLVNIYLIFFTIYFSFIIVLIFVTFFLTVAIAEHRKNLAPTDLGFLWREKWGKLGDDHELITPKQMSLTVTRSFYHSVLVANLF